MTAKELIAELATCQPDAEVCLGDTHNYRIRLTDVYTPVSEEVQLIGRTVVRLNEGIIATVMSDTRRMDADRKRTPESILAEATRIRSGERNADYGDAVESFEKIARVASEMTGKQLTPAECCKVLMAVKIVRESYNHKRDNLVDLCGYADILDLIEKRTNL